MLRYVTVYTSSDYFSPAVISYSNVGVIGEDSSSSLPDDPFLLTAPSGDNFDSLTTDSPLHNAITDTFKQGNVNTVWACKLSESRTRITDEITRQITTTTFQINCTEIYNIVNVKDGDLDIVSPTVDTATGLITFIEAPETPVYATYDVDGIGTALKKMQTKDIQIEYLAGVDTSTSLGIERLERLLDMVELASASQRNRIAVGALGSDQVLTSSLLSSITGLRSNRMVLVAHKCDEDDPAACMAGVIASYPPQQDMILRYVSCDQDPDDPFTDTEIDAFDANQIIAFQPNRWLGRGVFCRHGYNMSGSSTDKWIDFIRVSDYLSLRLIAQLTNPNVIGGVTFTPTGMKLLRSNIRASLNPAIDAGIIQDIEGISIPIEPKIIKYHAGTATEAEQIEVLAAKSQRRITDVRIEYIYGPAMNEGVFTLVAK